jgi:plastocyanin domain-containing protein
MILINLIGILIIGLIIWWFWLYKPKDAIKLTDQLTITVENGTYQPARIKLAAQQTTRLEFLRKDASPCAATVIFPALDLSQELAINRTTAVTLPALAKGEYAFHCPMKMYVGTVIVE